MTIDLTQNILDIEGKIATLPYKVMEEVDGVNKEVEKKEEVTLGKVIGNCVLYEIQDHSKMTEEEHLLRFDIYERTLNKEQVEFKEEEIKFIKGLVITGCMPIWAVQAIKMLNK